MNLSRKEIRTAIECQDTVLIQKILEESKAAIMRGDIIVIENDIVPNVISQNFYKRTMTETNEWENRIKEVFQIDKPIGMDSDDYDL